MIWFPNPNIYSLNSESWCSSSEPVIIELMISVYNGILLYTTFFCRINILVNVLEERQGTAYISVCLFSVTITLKSPQ